MIKVYKNVLEESEREKILSMIKDFPENMWTQSVCTDEEVIQLREYIPFYILKQLQILHTKMLPIIENDFSLNAKGVKLVDPDYCNPFINNIMTVDKRLKGMSLNPHADIPTGTFTGHIGSATGESTIYMSCVYYWNDDFEGGEIEFHENATPAHVIYQNTDKDIIEKMFRENDYSVTETYKPVAGDFIVFPSDLTHSIKEVISGERLSSQYFYCKKIN